MGPWESWLALGVSAPAHLQGKSTWEGQVSAMGPGRGPDNF